MHGSRASWELRHSKLQLAQSAPYLGSMTKQLVYRYMFQV